MRNMLCLFVLLFSSQIHANEPSSLLTLESPATKIDVIFASLYGKYSCKERYAVRPFGPASTELEDNLDSELCLSDLNYLPNIKTIRMIFHISNNHHLVNDFDKLSDENKSKAILEIAARIEGKAGHFIKHLSLLFQSDLPKFEFVISHNGYSVSRDRMGGVKSTKYEVNGF